VCLFGTGHPSRGVHQAAAGVSWEVDFEEIKNIPGVIEARWMNGVMNGEKIKSICSFDVESPYSNAVRAY
jgi:hypothetical protein